MLHGEAQLHHPQRGAGARRRGVSDHGRHHGSHEEIHARQHLRALALQHQLPADVPPHQRAGGRVRGVPVPEGDRRGLREGVRGSEARLSAVGLHLRAPGAHPAEAIIGVPELDGAAGAGVLAAGSLRLRDRQHVGGLGREPQPQVPAGAQCEGVAGLRDGG